MDVYGFVGVFNWMMFYSWDLEVYIFYGKYIILEKFFEKYFIGNEIVGKSK